MNTRQGLISCFFLSLATLLSSGCQQGPGGGDASKLVQIATTKADLFGLPAEYRALHMGLERALDRPISFMAQPGGAAIGAQLEMGHIPYAILTASEFSSVEHPEKLTVLATAVNELGKTSRRAHIVIKAKSHLKSIGDCAGKRFAFGHHKDALTDLAVRDALEKNGVPLNKLLPELVPTTVAVPIEGRLYCGDRVPTLVVWDLTINAGVIDEIAFANLPESGGNPITGPSRDQFEIVAETAPIPEMAFVAGPTADPALTAKIKEFLLKEVAGNEMICKQLGVKGFAEPDPAAYTAVRSLASHAS